MKKTKRRAAIKKKPNPLDGLQSQIKTLEEEVERVSRQRDALRQWLAPMTKDAFLMYKQQLGDLLTNEQKEHADAAGVSHDQYAMQLIRLCNMKISELSQLR
jgi:hypothetical protein